MLKLNDNFIGYQPSTKVDFFSGSDSEYLYKKNLESKPIDGHYRNVEITYSRNSLGHRCKEIAEIDLDNYILVSGCSHTEGIGLELETTYSHILAEKLKCDYYNLGLGGSGIDILLHNLTIWIATQPKKPKAVIIQWPYCQRFTHFSHDPVKCTDPEELILHISNPHTSNKSAIDMLAAGEDIHYFKTFAKLAKIKIDCMLSAINVPVYHICIENRYLFSTKDKILYFFGVDLARDNHSGIRSNRLTAETLYKYMHPL